MPTITVASWIGWLAPRNMSSASESKVLVGCLGVWMMRSRSGDCFSNRWYFRSAFLGGIVAQQIVGRERNQRASHRQVVRSVVASRRVNSTVGRLRGDCGGDAGRLKWYAELTSKRGL